MARSVANQVSDSLVAAFLERGLRPGDRVPSESEVCREFGVGRSTAREAFRLLEQDGVVEAVPGRGRFLTALGSLQVERPITRYESIRDALEEMGYQASTVVLSVRESEPTDEERAALGLGADDLVIRLERLRSSGDEVLIYGVDTIDRTCLPAPVKHLDWTGSLNELLEAQGLGPVSSSARIEAAELPEEVAERYSLQGLGPWLLITETAITRSGRRVLRSANYHRGGRFGFNVVRHR